MVGIPRDRLCIVFRHVRARAGDYPMVGIRGPEQGPDMPGNAPRPETGDHLGMYRQERCDMGNGMRDYIGDRQPRFLTALMISIEQSTMC